MLTGADLGNVLDYAGSKPGRKFAAYLIGGCAMTFMGRKAATKNIDIVFSSCISDFASPWKNCLDSSRSH